MGDGIMRTSSTRVASGAPPVRVVMDGARSRMTMESDKPSQQLYAAGGMLPAVAQNLQASAQDAWAEYRQRRAMQLRTKQRDWGDGGM